MKVLTLKQPWASYVMELLKLFETRSWMTKHRGDLLIHSSATFSRLDIGIYLKHREQFPAIRQALNADPRTFPTGKILGKVKLVDIFSTADNERQFYKYLPKERHIQEYNVGDFSAGRFGWVLQDVQKLDNPIPALGNRLLWDFPFCKVCGCWDRDACVHQVYGPCHWAEPDLCSNCKYHPGEAKRITINQP